MKYKTQLRRFGNSFGFLLTKPIARELGWDYETDLTLEVKNGQVIVRRTKDNGTVKAEPEEEIDLFANGDVFTGEP